MNRSVLYLFILMLLSAVCSCSDDESFTTDSSALLTFSKDTVKFDTLISTISSSTKTLYVFNHNKDGIRISNVSLQSGEASHFRVNVDGQYLAGGSGDDFEIMKKDSIVVRIEVTMPETGTSEPISYSDNLLFRLESGVVQRVVLTSGGMDAYIIYGMVVDEDLTLATDKPYVIYDSLVVREGALLTLAPGTTLMFHDKCGLDVYGTVHAEGTMEKPVVLRGDRTDHMFDYLKYDNTPSRWEGIIIREGSSGNRLVYTDLHSGRYGILCESENADEECLFVENSVIHNIGGDAIQLNGCQAYFANSQISNARGRCVSIEGGAVKFIHCTIAQFYLFGAERGEALFISNKDADDNYKEIRYAHFINTVITGYGDDVIMGNLIDDNDDCQYLFSHCFLNTVESDDEDRFVDIVYDKKEKESNGDPTMHAEENFILFDSYNFLYDFTPKAESAIRGIAETTYLSEYPTDRYGRMRDNMPDAGCYEYVDDSE